MLITRLLLVYITFTLLSCTSKQQEKPVSPYEDKIGIMNADQAFSDLSIEKGMRHAFIEYMDSNAVLLRPGYLPIIGARAVDFLLQQNDTGFTLKWQPHNAMVSKSADLGFTYGIWALQPKDQDTVFYGTYVNIWKKQEDGSWKYLLDAGNEGLGEPE